MGVRREEAALGCLNRVVSPFFSVRHGFSPSPVQQSMHDEMKINEG